VNTSNPTLIIKPPIVDNIPTENIDHPETPMENIHHPESQTVPIINPPESRPTCISQPTWKKEWSVKNAKTAWKKGAHDKILDNPGIPVPKPSDPPSESVEMVYLSYRISLGDKPNSFHEAMVCPDLDHWWIMMKEEINMLLN
jgi:hypothetical protein